MCVQEERVAKKEGWREGGGGGGGGGGTLEFE